MSSEGKIKIDLSKIKVDVEEDEANLLMVDDCTFNIKQETNTSDGFADGLEYPGVPAEDSSDFNYKESIDYRERLITVMNEKQNLANSVIEAVIDDSGSEGFSMYDDYEAEDLNRSDEDSSEHELQEFGVCDEVRSSQNWTKINTNRENNHLISLQGVSDYNEHQRPIGFEYLSPFQCFGKFFPQKMYEITASETNRYAKKIIAQQSPLPPRSRFRKWTDVSANDIKAFIALEIVMGMVQKPTLQSYYQQTFFLSSTPGFSTVMSRDQYILIQSFLHFCNNETADKNDRLHKIRPLLGVVSGLYTQNYTSSRELSVDETLERFNRKLFFEQYSPFKPSAKSRIKIWSLFDSRTGYLLKFNVYAGIDTKPVIIEGLGHSVVTSLLKEFEHKGHIVYLDDLYSSVDLYEDLKSKGIGACGTVKPNRKDLPSEMKTLKMRKGDLPTMWVHDNKSIIATSWRDTSKLNMISTIGNAGMAPIDVSSRTGKKVVHRPNIQVSYNKFKGGIDKFDQLCSTYPFKRKSKKWYQTIWHFIIEVALVNSNVCYNLQNPNDKMLPQKFREEVVKGMLEGYTGRSNTNKRKRESERTPMAIRLVERHFPYNTEGQQKPNCVVCSILPSKCSKKGKGFCKRKQTSYVCNECPGKPALCVVPCFEIFHTKKDYKKVCTCYETIMTTLEKVCDLRQLPH